jgi:YVTN family beta-propeller protein
MTTMIPTSVAYLRQSIRSCRRGAGLAAYCAALSSVALLSTGCKGSSPQSAAPAPVPAPQAPLVNPAGPRIYVSDETGRDVVVIDPEAGQVVGRIEVGKRPRGVRLTRDGKQLLIALSGSPIGGPGVDESKLPPADRAADGIGVVDIASGKLVNKFNSGQDPESFDISPDGKFLYVSNEDAAEMSVLDLASGNITVRVKVGEEPEGVTVRPDGRVVYVSCEGDNEIVAIDTASLKVVGRLQTAARPRSVVFTPDSKVAFIATENGNAVNVADALKHKVLLTLKIPQTEGTPTPPRPMGTVLSPDASTVFVSFGRAKSVGVIDVKTRTLTRTFENVGARPWGIGVSPDGRKVYTANGPSGDVSIVDVATGAVEKRVSVGGSPWGVAVAHAVPERTLAQPGGAQPPGR